jgi:hypothetical protein
MVDADIRPSAESPAVSCFAECPHFETVSGRCRHESRQVLVEHLMESDARCPVYDAWRADEMLRLERALTSE